MAQAQGMDAPGGLYVFSAT